MNMNRNVLVVLAVTLTALIFSCEPLNTGHIKAGGGSNNYTVSFDKNGGTGTAPQAQTVNVGDSVFLPGGDDLSKDGYDFNGWNTKADGSGDGYDNPGDEFIPTGSITLYAVWNESGEAIVRYTVTFNVNGGEGTAPAVQIREGSATTLPGGNGLSKEGYDFVGWNTKADGTGTDYDAGEEFAPSSHITLYAVWNESEEEI